MNDSDIAAKITHQWISRCRKAEKMVAELEGKVREIKRQHDPVSDLPGAALRGRAWAQHLVANQLLDMATYHWSTNEVISPEMIRGISEMLREQARENYETASLQQEKSAPKGTRMIPAEDIEIGMAIEGRMVRNKDVGKYFESLVVIWCETADDHGNHTLFFSRKMLVEVEGG